ncbi:MAG TPA: hypothetical protein VI455_15675 [Terriglobia bacterium]
MRKPSLLIVTLIFCCGALPLAGQQPCPSLTVVANSPEDQLLLAVNGADNPQDQIAALDKYAAAHADSPAMACVNEYYTAAYVKLNDFDKAIAAGEKDLAANYQDVNLLLNLAKAYVGAGKATDDAFSVIAKAPDQIKTETSSPRPAGISDDDWQKAQQDAAETARQERAYMEYAFFQLLPRVTDANKRLQYLDAFAKAYPDSPNAGQIDVQFMLTYGALNNSAQANEYGDKALAADPNNPAILNAVADNFATRQVNLDKAETAARKALDLVPALKKPDGVSDADFRTAQNTELGAAHLTIGYIEFQRASKTRKVAGAVQELKTAVGLLTANPNLQARALFYLGTAYEFQIPPDHHAATQALSEAVKLQSPWQGEAQALLAKIPQHSK